MRTCRHLFIFVLLLFACGCNKGPFDPTMYKDGFRGITYTNEYNEIIGPVEYLITEKSSGMTGQVISVDGGWGIW